VRIIAATNRDLKRAVEAGTFREDLYYRLNVITVELPPLRQRVADLLPFAEKYLQFFSSQFARSVRGFSPAARQHILSHHWPGNLRELRNAIERAVILAREKEIAVEDLPLKDSMVTGDSVRKDVPVVGGMVSLEEIENAHIRALLDSLPNLTEAAKVLGIDQTTLYRKRKKLGLE
jgi:NtrC-family two-component system response regulator AlgB